MTALSDVRYVRDALAGLPVGEMKAHDLGALAERLTRALEEMERDREFIEAAENVAILMDIFSEQPDDVHAELLAAYRKRREERGKHGG